LNGLASLRLSEGMIYRLYGQTRDLDFRRRYVMQFYDDKF